MTDNQSLKLESRCPIDPDHLIEKWLGRPKLAAILALVLTLYGCGSLFILMTQNRTAVISADPYTYLQFAQTLSKGSFHLQGPLADAIREFNPDPAVGVDQARPGPIWNTNVLPDGRTVYTVAMGYPLFLSGMVRLGGTWLYTHANLFLLALLLFLLFFCVWQGLGHDLFALVAAGMACLLLIRSHPPTFLQFSYPWREPLFYSCILGGIACVQLFHHRRILWLIPAAGFLLGYACAIKESNAIYGVVIGTFFLWLPSFRTSNRKAILLMLFGVGGVLGASPILIQNGLSSGNPLHSLQVARATADLTTPGGGTGLSPAHIVETFSRYCMIYRHYVLFWWPCVLTALLGVVVSWRHFFVRLCVGLVVVHLGLYLQWGNADVRHMYFVHIPYVVLLALGVVWMCRKVSQKLSPLFRFEHGLVLLPLLALSLWPSPWKAVPEEDKQFSYRDAVAWIQKLRAEMPERPVVLSNRVVRDVIGIYSDLPVVRLHDLASFHPDGSVEPVLDWLSEQGYALVFLDNADKDPRNVGRIDWAVKDEELLYEYFDLDEAFQLARDEWSLDGLIDKTHLTAYHVETWSRTNVAYRLDVPHDGTAYLYLNRRASLGRLNALLNGVHLEQIPLLKNFVPVHDMDVTEPAQFVAAARGALIPALRDVRLLSWTEPIKLDCGAAASPSDATLFPDGLGNQPKATYRDLKPPVKLRVPVRKKNGLFTTIGLGLNLVDGPTNSNVFVQVPGEPKQKIKVAGNTAWFPVTAVDQGLEWAGSRDIELSTDTDTVLRLSRVHSLASESLLEFEFNNEMVGVVLHGLLVSTTVGEGPHAWSVSVNGNNRQSGTCLDDPRRSSNRLRMAFSRSEADKLHLKFAQCGLINAAWLPVHSEVTLAPREPEATLIQDGVFLPEGRGDDAFWWTKAETKIVVPVSSGHASYRLCMHVGDMKPGRKRTFGVTFDDTTQTVQLPDGRGDIECVWDNVEVDEAGLRDLVFSIETWSPKDHVSGSEDRRELGFQLYTLQWQKE